MFRRRGGPSLLRTAAVVGTATAVSKGVSGSMDQAAMSKQQQMEQQTQILNELVATLGALDAHMQDIRTQVADIKKAG